MIIGTRGPAGTAGPPGPGGSTNSFSTIQTPSGTSPVASSSTDTLTLASTDLIVTGNSGTDTVDFELQQKHKDGNVVIILDGGGDVIPTGVQKFYIPMASDGTFTGWEIVADQAGSIVIDIWKAAYASFPPLVANTITGSALPTLSSAQKATSSTLTGWTITFSKGDYLEVNVNSVATVQKVILTLKTSR